MDCLVVGWGGRRLEKFDSLDDLEPGDLPIEVAVFEAGIRFHGGKDRGVFTVLFDHPLS